MAAATATAGDFAPRPSPAPIRTLRAGVIRVLIADLHAVALLHVRTMLAGARDITVVAEASPSHSAALVVRLSPDVIITELLAADSHGMANIRALSSVTPNSRVLIVSARPEAEWLLEALDAGAAGAIVANASREEVLTAVRAIVNGQIVLRRSAIAALTARARVDLEELESIEVDGHEPQRKLSRLTGREQSVFRMIAEGYSAPEIGARLFISKKTVETYKKRIGEKLGFSHRSEFVRFALQTAVLTAPRAQREVQQ